MQLSWWGYNKFCSGSVNKDCRNSIEMTHARLKHLKCSLKADSIIGHDGDIQNAVCSTFNASQKDNVRGERADQKQRRACLIVWTVVGAPVWY
jgi:hypothetical protein